MQAEKKNEYPPSIEADRKLLAFETYEEYLDSLITTTDLRNLGTLGCARVIAGFGYRTNGDTLSEIEFYKRRAVIYAAVFPKPKTLTLASEGANCEDKLNLELILRERANRLGILSTIIYVRNLTKTGLEISGYIDYAHSLIVKNWQLHFKHDKILWPKDSDLSYHHWRHGTVRSNITRNYIPILDTQRGLLFQNRHDHKMISPDPLGNVGENTNKQRVLSSRYLQVELYDHVVRKKC